MKTRKKSVRPTLHTINGYKILFVPKQNHTLHIECVIRNGFCFETKENSGINHLLEHVIVEGWKKCIFSCNSEWDKKGYYVNASTDKTTMTYYIKGLNTEWKKMIEYITSIIDHPMLTKEKLEKEKQAVIDELLTFSNDPDEKLIQTFNMLFYKIDGLKHADDWKLQIENLKKLNIDDVYRIYNTYYNVQNIMFIVMGEFKDKEIKSLFQKQLTKPKQGNIYNIECFTFKHDIVFSKNNIENTKVLIGFPYTKAYNYIHINSIISLLHVIFFDEFRTKKSLLYDISIFDEINACGTTIFIEFDVQTSHVVPVLKSLFKFIRHLQKTPIRDIHGFKLREIYDYIANTKSVMDYYNSLLYSKEPLYTLDEIIKKIKEITPTDIMHLIRDLFNLDHALCIYQCKKDLHLSMKDIF
jgi:predicted Zn-dependent peptidase